MHTYTHLHVDNKKKLPALHAELLAELVFNNVVHIFIHQSWQRLVRVSICTFVLVKQVN